jgi:hypothetical protein
VALLDLGLPARDGLLYLDTQSGFSFVDGVRNLRRLDQTLLHTALAHHSSGVAVLPLPASLAQVREISHADSVALIKRLTDFFDFQIADLGGFSTIDFVAQTVREAQRTWVVCDQSIGAIVSTANLLKDLRTREVDTTHLSLVVNKFDQPRGPHRQGHRRAPGAAAASRDSRAQRTVAGRGEPRRDAGAHHAQRPLFASRLGPGPWPAPAIHVSNGPTAGQRSSLERADIALPEEPK